MRTTVSGYSCCSRRNSVPKRTRTRDGEAVVTVAVRRPSPRIASSPKKSPAPSFRTSLPSIVTLAVTVAEDEERVARRAFPRELDAGADVFQLEPGRDHGALVRPEGVEERDADEIVRSRSSHRGRP